ncbi:MAG: hypothetical protein HY717_18040 [Planctomycetes bacterium]|nr:hypothetical protein [Planctomycetota bacterium]
MAGELWVDYKAVKASVTIDQVLGRYGLIESFKRQGDRLTGKCPVHKGTNPRQFSVDLKKGAWKCFSGQCGKSGNVIDLVAAIEGVEFREAALMLQEWFGVTPREDSKMTKKEWREYTKARQAEEASDRELVSGAVYRPVAHVGVHPVCTRAPVGLGGR